VRHFNVVGKAVFSDEELRKITAPFENRKITADELQEVRYRLTVCYVNRGYINSGAVNSGSEGTHGVIRMRIIEARLSRVNIVGNTRLRAAYIRPRVAAGIETPLNIKKLQENLQLL
jgi:hemolysin activation/secretion protein